MSLESDEEHIAEILKRVRRIELKTRGVVQDGIGGEYHSCFKGAGIDFEDFREYHHGDEIRSIDWKVTARMGTPFVRKFVEERELTVYLVVDASPSLDYGSVELSKREQAAEVAAVMAYSAALNHDKVGLILFGEDVQLCVAPQKGVAHVLRIVREILHESSDSRRTDPHGALRTLTNVATRRCLVFFISDFLFELRGEALRSAVARHDVVAVQVSDPAEIELPNAGKIRLRDPETGDLVEVNTANEALRQRYAQHRAEWQKGVEAFFRRHRVDLIRVRTDQDYLPALRGFFQKRTRVQL